MRRASRRGSRCGGLWARVFRCRASRATTRRTRSWSVQAALTDTRTRTSTENALTFLSPMRILAAMSSSRRGSPFFALVGCMAAIACSVEKPIDISMNRVSADVLAPDLIDDAEEIKTYIEAFPLNDYLITRVPGVGLFFLDDNPALVKEALRSGQPWEPGLQEVMDSHIRPNSVVLDVGAHIGSHTLPLAKAVGADGIVYAFEPQRKIYRELVKNIELNNLENVVPLRFAVGAEHGIVEMVSVAGRDGLARVGKGGEEAELRTIDSFGFQNVSLIKIDVEEYEGPVLMGALQTIRTWHPIIVIEILGARIYDRVSPETQRSIDRTRKIFKDLDYELEYISGADYLGIFGG